jgi:hypothetical protein
MHDAQGNDADYQNIVTGRTSLLAVVTSWSVTGWSSLTRPPGNSLATAGRASAGVLLAELVHATAGVDDLLLARVERMAVGADLDLQVMTQRGARNEGVTAAADHVDLFVLRMDTVFHGAVSGGGSGWKKGAKCSHAGRGSQGNPPGITQARRPRRRLPPRGRTASQGLDGGYPQSLWISVWMTDRVAARNAGRNMGLSNCSIFSQAISSCAINGLQTPPDISHVILSSTWGRYDIASRVCITRANGGLSSRFSKGILWVSSHDSRRADIGFRRLATVGFVLPSNPSGPCPGSTELREEQCLQVIQETLASGGRPPMTRCVLDEQSLPFGFRSALGERAEGQAGARLELPLVEALDQP